MTSFVTWAASPEGSLLIGGLLVTWAVQLWKRWRGTPPCSEATEKRLVAVLAAVLVAVLGRVAAGSGLDAGEVIKAALIAWAGGTTYHALLLRSPEAKAAGTPKEGRL